MKNKPWLIQRLSRTDNKVDENSCFSTYYSMDYMGAAEFEVGEIGKRLVDLSKNNQTFSFELGGMKIKVVFNPASYTKDEVTAFIKGLWNNSIEWRLKEPSYFSFEVFNPTNTELTHRYRPTKFDAWFDITYGMFWTHNNIDLSKFLKAINNSAEIIEEKGKAYEQETKRRKLQWILGHAPRFDRDTNAKLAKAFDLVKSYHKQLYAVRFERESWMYMDANGEPIADWKVPVWGQSILNEALEEVLELKYDLPMYFRAPVVITPPVVSPERQRLIDAGIIKPNSQQGTV